jgi:hypothetical protein
MRLPRYANRKTELAQYIGISLSRLYQLQRLPGFPRPRADGRWNVREVERFALNAAKKLVGPNERDRLQAELLNLKIRRATQELSEFEQGIREEITKEFVASFKSCMAVLATALRKMPNELSGQFAGMEPIAIFRLWKARLDDVLNQCGEKLKADAKLDDDGSNAIIPFSRATGNGAMTPNGAKTVAVT